MTFQTGQLNGFKVLNVYNSIRPVRQLCAQQQRVKLEHERESRGEIDATVVLP